MTAPKWSDDNPFVDHEPVTQQADTQQWSADNPFVDNGEHLALGQPVVQPQKPKEKFDVAGAARGAGRAVKEMVQGTAGFFADIGQSVNPGTLKFDAQGRPIGLEPAPQKSALELGKEAVLGPIEATAGGVQEAIQGQTTEEKAHGAVTGALGALGILGLAHGAKGAINKIRAPGVEAAAPPPTATPSSGPVDRIKRRQEAQPPASAEAGSFASAKTPEERAAIVARMEAESKVVEQKQQDQKAQLMRAVTAWNALTPEQRKFVVPGLADADYTRTWKELKQEARSTVRKNLNLGEPTSGTNLDTSQPAQASPSVPSAQGPSAPAELPTEPTGQGATGAAEAPVPTQAPEIGKQLTHEDVQFMDINSLRDEMGRAEQKVLDLTDAYNKRLVKSEPKSVELEFWEKYENDLKEEMALRLKRDPTGGTPVNTFEALDKLMEEEDAKPKLPDGIVDATGTVEKGDFHYLTDEQATQLRSLAKKHGLNLKDGSNYDLSAGKISWEALTDPIDGFGRDPALNDLLNEMGISGVKRLRQESLQAAADMPTIEAIKLAKQRVGEERLRALAKEYADQEGVPVQNYHVERAARDQLRPDDTFVRKVKKGDPAEAEKHFARAREIGAQLREGEKAGEVSDRMRKLYRDQEREYFLGNIKKSSSARASAIAYVKDQLMRPSATGEHRAFLEGLLKDAGIDFESAKGTADLEVADIAEQLAKEQNPNAPTSSEPSSPAQTPPGETRPEGPLELQRRIKEINQELAKDVDQRKFNDLVRERTDLEAQLGKDVTGDAAQKILEDNQSTSQAADKLAAEPFDPLRLEKIEQSIEDKTQVEKLLNEKPTNFAQIFYDSGLPEQKAEVLGIDAMDKKWNDLTPEQQAAFSAFVEERKPRTLDEWDEFIDLADENLDAGAISQEEHAKILGMIAEEKKALRAKSAPPPAAAGPKPKFKMPDTVGKDLNKFSNDQLSNVKKSIGAMLRSPDIQGLPEAQILRRELDRIFDYEAEVRRQSEGPAGPALSQRKIDVEGLPTHEQYFAKKVVTGAEFKQPFNIVKWIRQQYQGVIRPSHALNVADRLFEGKTGESLPFHKQAGKLLEMADGSLTKAEEFLRGDGPFVPDGNGGTQRTGAKPLADILVNTAKSDVERFGWLWAARRALDLKATRNKNIGVDLAMAQEMVINSPASLHQAVDEGRQYHSSLSLYAMMKGLISPESRAAMEAETAYGPIQRMHGPQEIVSKLAQTISATGKTAKQIMASDEFKRLRGSDLLIRNMVEASIDVTHRIIRAADMNETALALVDHALQQPDLYKGMIDKFEHREHLKIQRDLTARAEAVKALFEDAGITVSNEHATIFANLLSDDALSVKGGKLLVWREGKIEAWKVDELIADSLKSMSPSELGWFVKAMGAPARVGRLGIVLDPAFMMGQILNDQFQGWFNTRYGFTPVLDTFRGWWNIMHNTEAFREALRAGGIEKSALRGRTSITELLAGPAPTPGELAFTQLRTVHPFKALQTMLTPLREATRMGEYLKARGRGASAIEAAWAARDLLGNYSLQGTYAKIRALNHMSLFLNPALQVMDKTARTIRDRPVQWFTRASTLAGIAGLLYFANKDDEEIQQLRQTPGGQRWWFIREPVSNSIFKIRKPYLEGAIFADGAEAVLDSMRDQNPEAFQLWAQGVSQELLVNMMPVMGVVPAQLYFNQDMHSGSPIIPESQQGLDPQFQTGYYSSTADRLVGKATGIPPAILSYVTRSTTGYLGESAVKTVSAAIDWVNTGELPPVEELPLMQRVFAQYPSYSVKPVKDFYNMAQEVDRAAKTIDYAAQHSPDDLEDVFAAHEEQLPMIELFNDARQEIADLRKSIQAVEDIKDLGPRSKKEYTDEFLRTIIETSKATVEVARAMKEESQGQ